MSLFGDIGQGVGNLFALPLNVANAYASAYKAYPQALADMVQQRRLRLQMMQQNMGMMRQVGDAFQGSGGDQSTPVPPITDSGPSFVDASNAPDPDAPPTPPMMSQRDNSATGVYGRVQRPLAMMAAMSGHPEQAASILQSDVKQGTDGWLYDAKTGQRLGRIPSHQYTNGFLNDPGDPNAPGYIPTLPNGMQPDPTRPGSAMNIPGLTSAMGEQTGATTAATTANTLRDVTDSEGRVTPRLGSDIIAANGGGAPPPPVRGAPAGQAQTPQFSSWFGQPGGPPGSAPRIGQSTADKTYSAADAKQLSDNVQAATSNRDAAQTSLTAAQQGIGFVSNHKLDQTTPGKLQAASLLRSVGIPSDQVNNFANDAASYDQLVRRNVAVSARAMFPTRVTNSDITITRAFNPTLSTPNEAAGYFWGMQAAAARRQLDRANFVAQYGADPTTPKSNAAMESAWAQGAGSRSLFQAPELQGVKVGGKPLVSYYNYNGRKVGLVNMGGKTFTFYYVP